MACVAPIVTVWMGTTTTSPSETAVVILALASAERSSAERAARLSLVIVANGMFCASACWRMSSVPSEVVLGRGDDVLLEGVVEEALREVEGHNRLRVLTGTGNDAHGFAAQVEREVEPTG